MKLYSEQDEQTHILRAVSHLPTPGHFLDIGAFDGESFSNTCALVELGWSGVMVEPALEACAKLLKRHGNNPKVTIVHGVVTTHPGLVKFWNNQTTHSSTIQGHDYGRPLLPAYWTPGVLLVELLNLIGTNPVHVLSIDAEGESVNLLEAYPWGERALPLCVCVEHDQDPKRVAKIMHDANHRYRLVNDNGTNAIYRLGG
jgi:FkbM family methyltransferase